MAMIAAVSVANAAENPTFKRDVSRLKATDADIETNLKALARTEQPNMVALGTNTGSTFDLAPNGVMHLHFWAESPVVEVWSLIYLGNAGDVHIYCENGGSPYTGWLWFFASDKIYFLADGQLFEFDDAKLLQRIP